MALPQPGKKSPKHPAKDERPDPLPQTVEECDVKLTSLMVKLRQARLRGDEYGERICMIALEATFDIREDLPAPTEKEAA
jgi:hypothetical protein